MKKACLILIALGAVAILLDGFILLTSDPRDVILGQLTGCTPVASIERNAGVTVVVAVREHEFPDEWMDQFYADPAHNDIEIKRVRVDSLAFSYSNGDFAYQVIPYPANPCEADVCAQLDSLRDQAGSLRRLIGNPSYIPHSRYEGPIWQLKRLYRCGYY